MQMQYYRGALAIAAPGFMCSGWQATRRWHAKWQPLEKSSRMLKDFIRVTDGSPNKTIKEN
jgi:hypothetical protein